jgi:hypothetical protein
MGQDAVMDRSDPDWSEDMAEDRSLPVVQPSAFEGGMIAGLRRELATARQTIDTQCALIEKLTTDRDAWQEQARQLRSIAKYWKSLAMELWPHDRAKPAQNEPPTFPASALRSGDGIYRGDPT